VHRSLVDPPAPPRVAPSAVVVEVD
jgi:hypothetical protein